MTEPMRGEVPWETSPSKVRRWRGAAPPPWGEDRFSWLRLAACAGKDPELFFPEQGELWKVPLAKTACASCPAFKPCRELIDSIEGSSPATSCWGIWAGELPRERVTRRGKERRLYAESAAQLPY